MHWRQPAPLDKSGFTFYTCGPFVKKQKKNTKTGESWYIYQNELDKGCCQHVLVYGYLTSRIASDKIFRDKRFNISKNFRNDRNDRYQDGLTWMVYKRFNKLTFAVFSRSETLQSETLATWSMRNKFVGSGIKNKIVSNKKLAEELHKPIIRNMFLKKVYSSFIDDI